MNNIYKRFVPIIFFTRARFILSTSLILSLISGFVVGKDSQAVRVREINLEEIVNVAQHIFSGFCVGVESRYDNKTGRDAFFFKFKISKMIKGEQLNEFTFKMSKTAVNIGSSPPCIAENEVVIFLHGESDLGFTSPVGVGQGQFWVKYLPTGQKVVVNGNNNFNLFKGIDEAKYKNKFAGSKDLTKIQKVLKQQSGEIDYQTFITIVEGMIH